MVVELAFLDGVYPWRLEASNQELRLIVCQYTEYAPLPKQNADASQVSLSEFGPIYLFVGVSVVGGMMRRP